MEIIYKIFDNNSVLSDYDLTTNTIENVVKIDNID